MRFNISSRIHHFNRINLDWSWKRHLEDRRRLRVAGTEKGTLEKLKELMNIPKGV
tara:strand:+ start:319 stop:483 length:165 start_codon:yes stop_codon:yes gene_type:complete